MNQLFDYNPAYEGFELRYPSPPRVHWLVLFLAWIAIVYVIAAVVPERWQDIAQSLVVDSWVFYLCTWIRNLDPEAKSPFWCDVFVAVQLGSVGLGVIRQPWLAVQALILILALSSMVLGIATVFMIKSDLERHYNDREHAGLVLGGVMTFFFSFLYFQYHLYDIAKRRKRVAEALGARAYDVQSS